jgi:predicted Ser/Thr protein kinase
VPLGVLASIERSSQEGPSNMLGQGMNGRVYESVRKEFACYKVLFLERARQLQLNIIREATLQHDISEILQEDPSAAQVPEVIGFVEHSEVLAIMMNKIKGASMLQIFEGKAELPSGFDVDVFFNKLERAVLLMNQHGYYHRDLTNNSGNVMVDEEGNPWIIDFGSAIKALHPSDNDQVFQIKAGGAHILASDLSGVRRLKEKVIEYLRAKE